MIVDVQLVEICVSTDAPVENDSQEHILWIAGDLTKVRDRRGLTQDTHLCGVLRGT